MNVARLNFSHGTLEEHEVWIRRVRETAAALGQPVAILQDLAGPKLRVGAFPDGQVALQAGQAFTLSTKAPRGGETGVRVDFPEIITEIPRAPGSSWPMGRLSSGWKARRQTPSSAGLWWVGYYAPMQGSISPHIHCQSRPLLLRIGRISALV